MQNGNESTRSVYTEILVTTGELLLLTKMQICALPHEISISWKRTLFFSLIYIIFDFFYRIFCLLLLYHHICMFSLVDLVLTILQSEPISLHVFFFKDLLWIIFVCDAFDNQKLNGMHIFIADSFRIDL